MAVKVSDKELLKAIKTHRDANRICRDKQITLQTLQARVAKLTYNGKLKDPSQIKDLYRPVPKIVRFSQNGIIIPRTRIEGSPFQTGDTFRVTYDDERITLTKELVE